ncbi:putative adenine phosphoribosyltransferase [Bifidobacterium gallicum DSM 20093 = LMG 11596]|uniref:Adenine phosphoribosyltransferase n=2 Tax=Bifidobacterium gallicum DSM 20093 = LMG 11596 TaxID=561180 RepID=D1NTL6_9BIFI|nr:putative adenine phosphoribosyltransferase [Bifidobacterium gallicum DSM 20093 = LMG 11596]
MGLPMSSTDIVLNADFDITSEDIAISADDFEYLVSKIRTIPDFPAKGILFRDFMPVFADAKAFSILMHAMEAALPVPVDQIDVVAGLEARGFLFGPALAAHLGKGFVAVRKAGKLPPPTKKESYSLEYGEAAIEVESNIITEGQRVLIVDDLIATGGSARAARNLLQACGATIAGFSFVMELDGLDGIERLGDYPTSSLLRMPA